MVIRRIYTKQVFKPINPLVQTFGVNNRNELTNATRSGTLTVAGLASQPGANLDHVAVSGTGLSSATSEAGNPSATLDALKPDLPRNPITNSQQATLLLGWYPSSMDQVQGIQLWLDGNGAEAASDCLPTCQPCSSKLQAFQPLPPV